VSDKKKYPILHYAYSGKEARQFRVEFVPVDLGEEGLAELHYSLKGLLPGGWGDFIRWGNITLIDIAIDFPNVSVPDILFLPQQGATTKTWNSKGQLQTYQQGKSKGNCTSIYDRGAKRKAKGQSDIEKHGVRIERRLRYPASKSLMKLANMPNPFKHMSMCFAPNNGPAGEAKDYIWRLFLSAVDRQGLCAALGMLPVQKRTIYRNHYKQHQHSWWDAEKIWANWPKTLNATKICDLSAWD
jgi:hypothetical protein